MTIEVAKQALSAAPGALYASFTAEYQRMIDEAKGDRVEAAKLGVRRLLAAKLITQHDVTALDGVCGAVLTAARARTANRQQVFDQVRAIHLKMTGASDVANAFVGIVMESLAPAPQPGAQTVQQPGTQPVQQTEQTIQQANSQPVPQAAPQTGDVIVAARSSNTVDGAILGGALGGAVVGGAIGGIGGAIIGTVVGGIGAGIGAACT